MSFLFRHRDPGSRHVYRYGPLRITCVDRDVPIDVRVNAHLMYKVVLSWEDKARCATPFDMIARDLGEFWLLDQWSTGRPARLDPFAAQLRVRAAPSCDCSPAHSSMPPMPAGHGMSSCSMSTDTPPATGAARRR